MRLPQDRLDESRQQSQPAQKLGNSAPKWLTWLLILLAAGASYLLFSRSSIGPFSEPQLEISYSEFRQQVRDGKVAAVTIEAQQIQGEFVSPQSQEIEGETVEYPHFLTFVPSIGDDQLLSLLEQHDVSIEANPQTGISWLSILINLLPFALLFLLLLPSLRRMRTQGQGLFSIGRSRARSLDGSETDTTFEDVAGLTAAKRELQEVIEFLKDPDRFHSLGGEMPKGVLLVGPPGTGKTLLARAVAGEADVPFFSITGSDFMELFVGVGASRVRDLFKAAKEVAPSIIFIDEIDSIGRRRGAGLGGGHDEREQTLNQMLSELDGFHPNLGVIVMAATNRPDILDPALLRPGRFDRRVAIDAPTKRDRQAILELHARNKPLADDVDLEEVARSTPGFSGADLENLLNEAALLAARLGREAIQAGDIEEARDKVVLGLEREGLSLDKQELKVLAYHEGGHALVAAALPHADPLHKVSIVPRGRAMGVTLQLPERDKYIYARDYLLDRLAVMMGGRAAEQLVFDSATNGAENDLKQATHLARKMVLDWGMSEELGPLALGVDGSHVFLGEEIGRPREYSEATAQQVDREVRGILDDAYKRATNELRQRSDQLEELADRLLERETLSGDEVLDLLGLKDGRTEKNPQPA